MVKLVGGGSFINRATEFLNVRAAAPWGAAKYLCLAKISRFISDNQKIKKFL